MFKRPYWDWTPFELYGEHVAHVHDVLDAPGEAVRVLVDKDDTPQWVSAFLTYTWPAPMGDWGRREAI